MTNDVRRVDTRVNQVKRGRQQQPSGVQALRDLARRHNPRSQGVQQELMHFDFGREPAFSFVGEYESSSGEVLAGCTSQMRLSSGKSSACSLVVHVLVMPS